MQQSKHQLPKHPIWPFSSDLAFYYFNNIAHTTVIQQNLVNIHLDI